MLTEKEQKDFYKARAAWRDELAGTNETVLKTDVFSAYGSLMHYITCLQVHYEMTGENEKAVKVYTAGVKIAEILFNAIPYGV